ncbi:MAG: DUF378 domain-containing protein [Endozoicomonadaceae bacterium]|nr:DUF378 domain-containing protein [Endozoicomonadaceae bacterium]
MKLLNLIFSILTAVGAINWGLVGFFDFNLVTVICNSMPMLGVCEKIIYCTIGVSGVFSLITLCQCCSICNTTCTTK